MPQQSQGMPQLDASSFPSQLFWLTVTFIALYVLLSRVLLPRMQMLLALRSGTIAGDVQAASAMKAEAEEARALYEKALADARAKSQAMLAEAQAVVAARAAAGIAEMDSVIEKKLAASEASIRSARQEVMDKLTPVSGELAAMIVEMLVHHKPNAQEIGALITGLSKERAA